MANQVTLTFAGDADRLAREAQRAQQALGDVGAAAEDTGSQMDNAGESSGRMSDRLSNLGNMVSGATDAIGGITDAFQSFSDIQDSAREQANRTERALIDVQQAQEDLAQSTRDASQATIDADQAQVDHQQALLDQATAQRDLNTAIAEHGANSTEAKQAEIDLAQAGVDVKQSQEDQAQAMRDGQQALIDARTAQVDLNDAQHEVDPGPMQGLANLMQMFGPLLQGVVGVLGLVTAAQWVWNAALFASPVTWIVAGIALLVGAVILIATKTNWLRDAWNAAWNGIKATAENVWNWVKQIPGWLTTAFGAIGNAITAPFRAGFNAIAHLWNSTVGSLSWTVPDWVPFIGGSSISAPRLPTFHTGGVVEGAPGQEVLALLQAGETVTPAGRAPAGTGAATVTFAGDTDSAFASAFMQLVRSGEIQVAA
jgi:hypothetical protein